jgi:hypothetical protein
MVRVLLLLLLLLLLMLMLMLVQGCSLSFCSPARRLPCHTQRLQSVAASCPATSVAGALFMA